MFGIRLKELRIKKGYSMDKLIESYNARYDAKMNKSTLSRYENGLQDPIYTVVVNLADFFNVSVDYISGIEKEPTTPEKSNAIFIDNNCIYMIPVYESVSAGFGAYASDYITDYMPCYISNKAEADATLCIVVTGDSMYPKIENGDTIQVHKQSSVDSGSIAVVLIDKTEALVKKVVYGDDWIELHSINPMYPVQRFDGKDVLRIEVLGLVKKIIKNV